VSLAVGGMAFERAKYLGQFEEEAGRCLTNLARCLASLPGAARGGEVLRAMARDAHTLRGSAAMIGCGHLAARARLLEEHLEEAIREGAPVGNDRLARLAGGIDSIRRSFDSALAAMKKERPAGRRRDAGRPG